MKPDLHQMMRVGIVTFMAFPDTMNGEGAVVEAIESICNDPYSESIELTQVRDEADRKKVAELLASSHMEVGFACQPIQLTGKLDLNAADESERRRAVETLTNYLRWPKSLAPRRLPCSAGAILELRNVKRPSSAWSTPWHSSVKRRVPDDIAVTLEVFDREIDKKALIGSTKDAVRVAARLRPQYPDFGLILDLSHLPLQGESSP